MHAFFITVKKNEDVFKTRCFISELVEKLAPFRSRGLAITGGAQPTTSSCIENGGWTDAEGSEIGGSRTQIL